MWYTLIPIIAALILLLILIWPMLNKEIDVLENGVRCRVRIDSIEETTVVNIIWFTVNGKKMCAPERTGLCYHKVGEEISVIVYKDEAVIVDEEEEIE